MQDLNGWQDEHAEKDLKENQRGSGQDSPATRCPLEQELLGRHPQWHGKGKAPVRSETTHGDVSAVPHHHTRTAQLCNYKTELQLQDHLQSGLQEEC